MDKVHVTCVEWVEKDEGYGLLPQRCNEPAVAILWGKLFVGDAFGPKCAPHAEKYLEGYQSIHEVLLGGQHAIFDLRGLYRNDRGLIGDSY